MPYITINREPRMYQITFEDILNGIDESKLITGKDTKDTTTWLTRTISQKLIDKTNFDAMSSSINSFCRRYEPLINATDKSVYYTTFLIEKRNKDMSGILREILRNRRNVSESVNYGGIYRHLGTMLRKLVTNHPCSQHEAMEAEIYSQVSEYVSQFGFVCSPSKVSELMKDAYRRIDAPDGELKAALYQLKDILEKRFYASYHTCAFAYIGGRSTIDCVRRHQSNNSRWFLKLDFSKFFPSTTSEFVTSMLYKTYPLCKFAENRVDKSNFEKALSLCFLNGGLPQGTPVSPLLTNMMMIPIDHAINSMCHKSAPYLCYTRYADDLLISSQMSFKWDEVQAQIVSILSSFDAPFTLNTSKTRYGSSAGRNWNLGVMLNKDNQITIGYKKKKEFKAMLHQFMMDAQSGMMWGVDDVQHLLGLLSYYRMVEGEAIDKIVSHYSEKFNRNIEEVAKSILVDNL